MVVGGEEWTVTKPSRSDEVIDADQQLQIANQVRAHFDSLAPKRPIKPNRSESDQTSPTSPTYVTGAANKSIPELDKLRSLKSQSDHATAIYKGEDEGVTVQDEFVETQYYKELGSIDKQHHTTGSGFIKAVPVREGGVVGGYHLHLHLHPQSGANTETALFTEGFRSNPATNDWIPSVVDADHHQVVSLSSKPSRSESS